MSRPASPSSQCELYCSRDRTTGVEPQREGTGPHAENFLIQGKGGEHSRQREQQGQKLGGRKGRMCPRIHEPVRQALPGAGDTEVSESEALPSWAYILTPINDQLDM